MDQSVRDEQAEPTAINPWSPQLRTLTIGALVTIVAGAFEALAVATIMPRTVDDLGGLHYYGWSFSAYLLANIIGLTVAGAESDRKGPGKPYLAGIIFFSTGLLIAGLAPTMLVLILGRAVQGFGGGMFNSAIYVVVGRAYPEAAKPRMLALMSSAWVMPGLIGPAFAGLIADYTDWRVVFLGLLPFLGIAVLMAYPRIRTIGSGSIGGAPNWRRFGEATALSIGATLLIAGLGFSELYFALPSVAAGGYVTYRMLQRLMPAGTLRLAAGLPAAIAVMALLNLGFFGVDAFVPLALTDIRDRSTAFAGLALTAATVTWSAGSWIQAHYSATRSRQQIIRLGLVLIAIGCAGTLTTLFHSVPVVVSPLSWAVAGLGMGFAYSGVSLTVFQTATAGREGAATSSMQLASILGTAMGAGIGGAWIAGLSEGDKANRSALVVQDLLMIGVLVIAFIAVRQIPKWPGRAKTTPEQAPATDVAVEPALA
ncbi:MAG: MFS transporter [Thermomicrobiales bacterium]